MKEGKGEPEEDADDEGGEESAEEGHGGDGEPFFGEVAEVDVEGACEEEEREHAVEEDLIEVDAGHEMAGVLAEVADDGDVSEGDEGEGGDQGDEHDADGGGEANVLVVDVTEEGGEDDEDGDDFEEIHGKSGRRAELGMEGFHLIGIERALEMIDGLVAGMPEGGAAGGDGIPTGLNNLSLFALVGGNSRTNVVPLGFGQTQAAIDRGEVECGRIGIGTRGSDVCGVFSGRAGGRSGR